MDVCISLTCSLCPVQANKSTERKQHISTILRNRANVNLSNQIIPQKPSVDRNDNSHSGRNDFRK
jgi:hypothetical protein